MASEAVMYQAVFVIGIFVFGFFSITFNNYYDITEDTVLEGNLSVVIQDIGEKIQDLVSQARDRQTTPGNSTVSIRLNLESQYGTKSYSISFYADSSNEVFLYGQTPDSDLFYGNYSLGYILGTDDGNIDCYGTLFSSDGNPMITYKWDSSLFADGNSSSAPEELFFN